MNSMSMLFVPTASPSPSVTPKKRPNVRLS
jgi:hypothetical protein